MEMDKAIEVPPVDFGASPVVGKNGTITHMYPFYFTRVKNGVRESAGIERIGGVDYTFGDLDVIFDVPADALNAFRGYLESLPRLTSAASAAEDTPSVPEAG